MNEEVSERNQHQKLLGKRWLLKEISNKEFWKFICWILPAVTYCKKVYRLCVSTTRKDLGKAAGKIDRDVCGKTYLLKISCSLYHFHYSFLCHGTILYYTTSFIILMFLWLLTSLLFTDLWCFCDKIQGFQVLLYMSLYVPIRKKVPIPFG